MPVKGTLYITGQKKPVADLTCEVFEYTDNHRPGDRYRINYEYVKRHQKVRIELIRETPMRLELEDGRRADVTVQCESTAPNGGQLGVLRVKGDFTH